MEGVAVIAENTADHTARTSPEAFDELLAVHRPRIFRFAFASLRDRDAAESVTQDCFLRAYQAWPQFRGDASVQTWLTRIAINLIRDATRNRRFQFWKRAKDDVSGYFIPDAGSSPVAGLPGRIMAMRSRSRGCRVNGVTQHDTCG